MGAYLTRLIAATVRPHRCCLITIASARARVSWTLAAATVAATATVAALETGKAMVELGVLGLWEQTGEGQVAWDGQDLKHTLIGMMA